MVGNRGREPLNWDLELNWGRSELGSGVWNLLLSISIMGVDRNFDWFWPWGMTLGWAVALGCLGPVSGRADQAPWGGGAAHGDMDRCGPGRWVERGHGSTCPRLHRPDDGETKRGLVESRAVGDRRRRGPSAAEPDPVLLFSRRRSRGCGQWGQLRESAALRSAARRRAGLSPLSMAQCAGPRCAELGLNCQKSRFFLDSFEALEGATARMAPGLGCQGLWVPAGCICPTRGTSRGQQGRETRA